MSNRPQHTWPRGRGTDGMHRLGRAPARGVICANRANNTLALGIAGFLVSDLFIRGRTMVAVPMRMLFIFLQRYVVQGLTMGAVKG